MNTTIPGMKAVHFQITPNCRKRGQDVIVQEVVDAVATEIRSLDNAWAKDSGVHIHIVVTLERPEIIGESNESSRV